MLYSHHLALLFAYAVAVMGWLAVRRAMPTLWPKREGHRWQRPWREVGWGVGAVVGIVTIGQIYGAGWLLPRRGSLGEVFEAINQVLVFSPIFLLLAIRRQPLSTAWLPTTRIWARLGVGLGLALFAILVFTRVRVGSEPWSVVVSRVYTPRNIAFAVQVLLEDIAVAVLFVRFAAALGLGGTILLVAVLFAAGHIPAMLQEGQPWNAIAQLVLDAGLAATALWVVQKSADIWWFWMIHFAMDMMQFYAVRASG